MMREQGTESYCPRRTLKRSHKDVRRKTSVSTTAPPVFNSALGTYHCEPCLIQLWKLSYEGKMPHFALSGKLEFFCPLTEKKKVFSIPSYLKYCVVPLEGRLLMKFQDPHCSSLLIRYSVDGLGSLWTRSSLHRHGEFLPQSAPQIATWEETVS